MLDFMEKGLFWDKNTKQTWNMVGLMQRGLPMDLPTLKTAGIYPLRSIEQTPLESALWTPVMEGQEPHPSESDPTVWEWSYEKRAKTVAESVPALKALVHELRKNVEEGGILLANGTTLGTTKQAQARMTNSLMGFDINPDMKTVNWKNEDGTWAANLTKTDLIALAKLISIHVEACFDREMQLCIAIDEAAVLDSGDLEKVPYFEGWPANSVFKPSF